MRFQQALFDELEKLAIMAGGSTPSGPSPRTPSPREVKLINSNAVNLLKEKLSTGDHGTVHGMFPKSKARQDGMRWHPQNRLKGLLGDK
jgi:hypothetical protein